LQQIAGLKNLFYIVFIIFCSNQGIGQTDSVRKPDTTLIQQPKPSLIDTTPEKNKPADSSTPAMNEPTLQNDSLIRTRRLRDSLFLADSLRKASVNAAILPFVDTSTYKKYQTHPYLPLNKPGVFRIIDYREKHSKDDLFYLMAGVIFFLAFIRAVFSKYFRNLFLLFFQTSLRQKQTREQLLQNNLASLFINLLFFISAGLYISLLIKHKNWATGSYWWLALYCGIGLIFIYLVKYLFLLFAGWVFNTKEAAGSYIFLVFMVNKVMGIILVPFLLILSFAKSGVIEAGLIVSYVIIGLLYVYRYLLSFGTFRNKLKVNGLHFFLYLCAVELLPLLLICKGLIIYTAGSF
jgi:hypothetical protein